MKDARDSRLITAFFPNQAMADQAYAALLHYGLRPDDVSVVAPKSPTQNLTGPPSGELGVVRETKAPEGATAGATLGGTVGAIAGLLLGAGSLVLPGVGLVIAGPLVALLAGAGVGGAAGTLVGGLIGLGVPEFEARQIEDRVAHGGLVMAVTVHESQVAEARSLLKKYGGEALTAEHIAGAR